MSTVPSRWRERWNNIAPAVRRTFPAVPVGLVGLGGGIYLDSTDFWSRHAFLGNLAVNVASACIAIPLALFVLSYLQGKQAETVLQGRIRRRAAAAAEEMTAAVMQPFGNKTASDVIAELNAIRTLNAELKSLWNFPAPGVAIPPGAIPRQRYSPLIDERNKRVQALFGVDVGFSPTHDETWIAHIREQWDSVRQVRSAAIEVGLVWPPAETTVRITTMISRLGVGPQSAFIGYPTESGNPEVWDKRRDDMRNVDRWVDACCDLIQSLPQLNQAPQG
ncbi:hypothetical protein [Streptomyces sp. NPDC102347]|uniref:hypothetical protein n=1 Tax=Streptomyces sp. NPDC102347 TaxID=3366157 RepID=UPI003814E8D1